MINYKTGVTAKWNKLSVWILLSIICKWLSHFITRLYTYWQQHGHYTLLLELKSKNSSLQKKGPISSFSSSIKKNYKWWDWEYISTIIEMSGNFTVILQIKLLYGRDPNSLLPDCFKMTQKLKSWYTKFPTGLFWQLHYLLTKCLEN